MLTGIPPSLMGGEGVPTGLEPQAPANPAPASDNTTSAPPASTGSSEASPLAFLRNQEMFQQMRTLLQRDPGMLNAVLQQLRQTNPELLQLISQNQEAFIRMINEPDSGSAPASGSPASAAAAPAPGGGPGLSEDMPGVIAVSQQDKEAIERVSFSLLKIVSQYLSLFSLSS